MDSFNWLWYLVLCVLLIMPWIVEDYSGYKVEFEDKEEAIIYYQRSWSIFGIKCRKPYYVR